MNPLALWLWICVWSAIHADLCDTDVARDERIAALVRALGHDEFPSHVAVSQELVNIGEPRWARATRYRRAVIKQWPVEALAKNSRPAPGWKQ